jgi:hypothetical protein
MVEASAPELRREVMFHLGWNAATNATAVGWFKGPTHEAHAPSSREARFHGAEYNDMCEKKFVIAVTCFCSTEIATLWAVDIPVLNEVPCGPPVADDRCDNRTKRFVNRSRRKAAFSLDFEAALS